MNRLTLFTIALFMAMADLSALRGEEPQRNRLADEASPYLLQHASNPVDWYPWGPEAFEKARLEGKPIFLSIGYSTCHWCHVMAEESFSDPAIAKILDEHFVSIKVDREERPDVDAHYQSFLRTTGSEGGWPANIFLTPGREPFFGGTYFPPRDQEGRLGFQTILQRLNRSWIDRRSHVEATAREMLRAVADTRDPAGAQLDREMIDEGFVRIAKRYDPRSAGFGPAPRFPEPALHEFLLRYHVRTGADRAARMSLDTLRAMSEGGIYDQIGGGFHRYSVDAGWSVPHFEKMLYDQALLVEVYLSAYQLTGEKRFASVTSDTLEFVLGSLTSPEGGFYSALDATTALGSEDSEKREGAFYTWSLDELAALFGKEELPLVVAAFGVREGGNVPTPFDVSGELAKRNVLVRRTSVEKLARQLQLPPERVGTALREYSETMRRARSSRPHPALDDKVLSSWNGLMIGAFARGGNVLGNPTFTNAAVDAARFVENHLWDPESGTLWRRWRNGDRGIEGFAEDYAFLIDGLLELYEATFDLHWIELASRLQQRQDELFWNDEKKAYSFSAAEEDPLRFDVPVQDESTFPSHHSVSVMNLLHLGQLTGNEPWVARAEEILSSFSGTLSTSPESMPLMLSALSRSRSKPRQIIVAGRKNAEDTEELLALVHERYLPDRLLLLADGSTDQARLSEWLPFVESVRMIEDRATAYVCENFTCKLPSNDPERVSQQLDGEPARQPRDLRRLR